MSIRKHQPEDLEVLLEIWFNAQSLAHPFLDSAFLEQVKEDMRNKYMPGSDTWVYENKGELLGFISMMGNEIGGLFVAPSHHKKGVGGQLVAHILQWHNEPEVEVFEQNEIGRAFYEKYGFKEVKRYFHEQSNQDVLRLKLPAKA